MIRSFAHKGLEDFFYDGSKKGIQAKHGKRLGMVLDLLEAAHQVTDMDFPGSKLHLLYPKQERRWSVKISGNWRVTFVFLDGDAYEVDYTDYH